jgi:hypothetical protein
VLDQVDLPFKLIQNCESLVVTQASGWTRSGDEEDMRRLEEQKENKKKQYYSGTMYRTRNKNLNEWYALWLEKAANV